MTITKAHLKDWIDNNPDIQRIKLEKNQAIQEYWRTHRPTTLEPKLKPNGPYFQSVFQQKNHTENESLKHDQDIRDHYHQKILEVVRSGLPDKSVSTLNAYEDIPELINDERYIAEREQEVLDRQNLNEVDKAGQRADEVLKNYREEERQVDEKKAEPSEKDIDDYFADSPLEQDLNRIYNDRSIGKERKDRGRDYREYDRERE